MYDKKNLGNEFNFQHAIYHLNKAETILRIFEIVFSVFDKVCIYANLIIHGCCNIYVSL
jgi:hypothetical protein